MANYPTYYPSNQIPMYQAPIYGTQNPYMAQPQQYQQNFQVQQPQIVAGQAAGLNGRIVDDFSALSANDVPMDGNGAIFIKRDGTEIQMRNWTAQGTIQTTRYEPILAPQSGEAVNNPQKDLNGLYEDVRALRGEITERLDRLEQSLAKPLTKRGNSLTKKEADPE